MAVTRAKNVIRVSADNDTITGLSGIIEHVSLNAAGDTATAHIHIGSDSGMILWSSGIVTAGNKSSSEIGLRVDIDDTLHINITGTAPALYLYLKPE